MESSLHTTRTSDKNQRAPRLMWYRHFYWSGWSKWSSVPSSYVRGRGPNTGVIDQSIICSLLVTSSRSFTHNADFFFFFCFSVVDPADRPRSVTGCYLWMVGIESSVIAAGVQYSLLLSLSSSFDCVDVPRYLFVWRSWLGSSLVSSYFYQSLQ